MLNEDIVIEGLDISDAMRRLRNNTKLYTRLVGRFLGGAELDSLKDGIKSGDVAASIGCAHTLKGAAANLSAVDISRLAAELEKDLKGTDSICGRHLEMLSEIENLYSALRGACNPYLEG